MTTLPEEKLAIETEQLLIEAAPVFFRSKDVPASPFSQLGFEIDKGWWGIAARMAQNIEKLLTTEELREATYCTQIKEKFGELRVYLRLRTRSFKGQS